MKMDRFLFAEAMEEPVRYTFHMQCDEDPGIPPGDGSTRIFLNTRGTNPEGVSEELIEKLNI